MSATPITRENIYDYFVIEEWRDVENGFIYSQSYDKIGVGFEELHHKMFAEIRLNYENFTAERSCMWVEEVKRRANWVRGETICGESREKHYTYQIWWSKKRMESGYYDWVIEADGYVSFVFRNGYTRNETTDTKYSQYIRPDCLYNDKNCDKPQGKYISPKETDIVLNIIDGCLKKSDALHVMDIKYNHLYKIVEKDWDYYYSKYLDSKK